MAKQQQVKIEGLQEFYKAIEDLTKGIRAKQTVGFRMQAAEAIVADAKSRAPFDSGKLREAIHAKEMPKGGVIAAVDRKQAPHAHLLEFGTSRMAAKPYFRPAVDAQTQKVLSILEQGYSNAIKGAVK